MSSSTSKVVCLLPLLAAVLLLAGCGKVFERIVSDSATRLAYQIRDEAELMKKSGETTRTFTHRPAAWPDGLTGDYQIVFSGPPEQADGRRGLFTSKSYNGPLWSSTTYHLNFVRVPRALAVAHRRGEPTIISLELRNGMVLLIAMK